MISSWTSNNVQSLYSVFLDPKWLQTFQNGVFQTETRLYTHRVSSTDQRSLTLTLDKLKQYLQTQAMNTFQRKWETHPHVKNTAFFTLLQSVCIFT